MSSGKSKKKKRIMLWLVVIVVCLIIIFNSKTVFKKIIGFIISKNEGGYVNDPDDPGGETKYGIAKRWHPDLDIKNLTLEQAEQIYYDEYFKKIPVIADLNLYYQVVDMAINAGVNAALKLYHIGISLDEYRQARLDYYSKLKGWANPNYRKAWTDRVNRNII